MKVIYDRDSDTLSFIFKEALVDESDEVRDGIILDYDAEGTVVSMEILNASKRITRPEGIEFQLAK
jgi:uncharacterized protein YuzE